MFGFVCTTKLYAVHIALTLSSLDFSKDVMRCGSSIPLSKICEILRHRFENTFVLTVIYIVVVGLGMSKLELKNTRYL